MHHDVACGLKGALDTVRNRKRYYTRRAACSHSQGERGGGGGEAGTAETGLSARDAQDLPDSVRGIFGSRRRMSLEAWDGG